MFPVPSKDTPPIVRAFCKAVAVAASPDVLEEVHTSISIVPSPS